ncbi:MAG: DUF4153 domain-containing protein [Bacillota bacterium]|jgi:hypothetical protein
MKNMEWLKSHLAAVFKNTFIRFPLLLLLCLAAAVLGVICLQTTGELISSGNVWERLLLVTELAIPIFLAIYLFFEYRSKSLYYRILVFSVTTVLLLIYLFFALTDPVNQWQMMTHIIMCIVACSFWIVIPWLLGRDAFEDFFVHCISRFFWALLFAVILAGGLFLIFFAVDQLLFTINDSIYPSILIVVGNVFLLSFFFSQLPQKNEVLRDYPKGLHIIFLYILLPLFVAYSLVFYIYGFRILITGVWPQGIVAGLALAHFAVGLLLIMVLQPLKNNKLLQKIRRYLPLSLIPTLLLYIMAFSYRIMAYGITEKRYYLIIVAIFVAISIIWLLWKKGQKTAFIIIIGSALAMISLIGPWNAYNISCYSQSQRLDSLLVKNHMLDENGNIIPASQNLSFADKQSISSALAYLQDKGQYQLTHLPEKVNIQENSRQILGFDFIYDWETDPNDMDNKNGQSFHFAIDSKQALPIAGYSNLVDINYILDQVHMNNKYTEPNAPSSEKSIFALPNGINVLINYDSANISAQNIVLSKEGAKSLNIDLSQIAEQLYKNAESSELVQQQIKDAIFDFSSQDGKIEARVIIRELYATYYDADAAPKEGSKEGSVDGWTITLYGYLLIK